VRALKTLMLASSAAAFKLLTLGRNQPAARALLSHKFLTPNEPKSQSLDRLRRQLEWLQSAYKPMSVPDLIAQLVEGNVSDNSIVFDYRRRAFGRF
jgi:1,6-anhydro-N-acetylmuramate kinase